MPAKKGLKFICAPRAFSTVRPYLPIPYQEAYKSSGELSIFSVSMPKLAEYSLLPWSRKMNAESRRIVNLFRLIYCEKLFAISVMSDRKLLVFFIVLQLVPFYCLFARTLLRISTPLLISSCGVIPFDSCILSITSSGSNE